MWDEPTLVSFLIVFLLYCTYYPLRFAIEDRDRQARYASVFAITAGAFVPLNFMAVRMAESLVHPRTFATAEGGMPGEMWLTFLVCACRHGPAVGDAGSLRAGRQVLARADLAGCAGRSTPRPPGERARGSRPPSRPGARRELAMPALPLDEAGKYVAAAYLVFLALVLLYVAIMAARLARIDRELGRAGGAGGGALRWLSFWRSASRTRPLRSSCASGWP